MCVKYKQLESGLRLRRVNIISPAPRKSEKHYWWQAVAELLPPPLLPLFLGEDNEGFVKIKVLRKIKVQK